MLFENKTNASVFLFLYPLRLLPYLVVYFKGKDDEVLESKADKIDRGGVSSALTYGTISRDG